MTQNRYFTYQRKGNHELQIQALNIIVADLQNQINNLTSGDPGSGDPDGIGTIYVFILICIYLIYIYKYVGTDICMYHLINPVPRRCIPRPKKT